MPTTEPDPAPPLTAAEQDVEQQLILLSQLAGFGMNLVRAIDQVANAHATAVFTGATPAAAGPLPELATAYDRIARAIRRTVLLSKHLKEPAAPRKAPRDTNPRDTTPSDNTPRETDPAAARAAARRRILREVEDVIESRPGQERDADTDARALRAELAERLECPDLDDDLDTRPAADIIRDIVRDLGLGNTHGRTFKRRTPADIRAMNQQAARPNPAPNDTNPALKAAPD